MSRGGLFYTLAWVGAVNVSQDGLFFPGNDNGSIESEPTWLHFVRLRRMRRLRR